MYLEGAYRKIIKHECERWCKNPYPNCKNIDCGWYIALEALRRAMCYKDGEQNEK